VIDAKRLRFARDDPRDFVGALKMTPNDSPPSPDQLEEVFNSMDAVEVGMARDLLESSGMECFVFDASASQMLGSTAAVTVRLMVHAEDAVEAREALKELGFKKM